MSEKLYLNYLLTKKNTWKCSQPWARQCCCYWCSSTIMRQGICSHSIVTITLNNPVTPAKPTRNRPQTDKSHQVWGEIGLQSVLIRFCQFWVGLCSGRQFFGGEIFQTCLKDLSPTNCRLCVGYMSVWFRFCRGAFGDVSVLIRPQMVDGLSFLNPSHTGQTDTKPTSSRQKSPDSGRDRFTVRIDSVLSVWCRFMFGQTNLSGRNLSNMFERSLPEKLSVACRLYVGVVSVLSGSVRGRVGLNSATDGRCFVGLRSVMYRAYVGRPDTDSRPIQDRIKSDITPTCVESADTFPNQNRRMPDISRTQTECKPITVCGVIPTYKSTQNPENISSPKWRHKMAHLEVCHN